MAKRSSAKRREKVSRTKVADAERLAKSLVERLHDCSEDELRQLRHIVKVCEGGVVPFEGWVIVEPRTGVDSLSYIADDGELYCLVETVFEDEAQPAARVRHHIPWRDVPVEAKSWVHMLNIAIMQMTNALEQLNPR